MNLKIRFRGAKRKIIRTRNWFTKILTRKLQWARWAIKISQMTFSKIMTSRPGKSEWLYDRFPIGNCLMELKSCYTALYAFNYLDMDREKICKIVEIHVVNSN